MSREATDRMVTARSLLTPNRFDVIAKYIYAKWRLLGQCDEWTRRLYLDHIEVFNGFVEPDGSGKNGRKSFVEAFDALIDSIASGGFDAALSRIPLAPNGEITNGAHRLAACLAAGCELTTEAVLSQTAYAYDHRWFQRRGLSLVWADTIASEACRLLPGSFVVVVYPSAVGEDDTLESLISSRARIWYRKQVRLTDNGAINLIQQIYRRERWVGSPGNDYKGAHDKKSWCFRHQGPIRAFLVESELDTVRALKEEIRGLYRIDNHSVHINDTHAEALELAGLLFNENSVAFLNARARNSLPWFDTLLRVYADGLSTPGVSSEACCVDGSGVLAAYGIRDVRDIDFLHDSHKPPPTFAVSKISPRHEEVRWHGCPPDSIVHNPLQHFYFDAMKFARLDLVRDMKIRRGEGKDLADVALIDDCATERSSPRESCAARTMRMFSWNLLYQRARFLKLRLRLLCHKLGL